MNAVPNITLDSAAMPRGSAFAAYQATLPFYRLTLGPGVTAENFEVFAKAWLLEDLILSRTRASAIAFSRTLDHIRSDGTNSLSFFAFTSGNWVGDFDGRLITVGPGQIVGFDLSKPFDARSTDHSALALVVARTSVARQYDDLPNLHGHLFEGAAAEILLDHMLSLERHVGNMRTADIATVTKATVGIINAALTKIPNAVRSGTGC